MYSINEHTQTTSASLIEVGIQENVSIVDIAVEDMKKDGTGGKVLRFHFEDQTGGTFTHTEFEPKENPMSGGLKANRDPKKQLQKDVEATMSRIKHLVSAFVPADKVIVRDAKSWTDFITKIVKIAGSAYNGRLFRLKLVLNNKDYPAFPRFVREGFIEPMEIEKTAMRFDKKYDRLEPKQATTEDEFGSATHDQVADEFAPDVPNEFDLANGNGKVNGADIDPFSPANLDIEQFDNLLDSQEMSSQPDEDEEPF